MRKRTLTSGAGVLVAFLCAYLLRQSTLRVNGASYVLVTESGGRLASLFDQSNPPGLVRLSRNAVRAFSTESRRPGACPGRGGVVGRLAALLETPVVEAASCSPGECGGSYSFGNALPCGQDCGGGWFTWYYSDPLHANPCDGWRYTGGTVCPANDGSGGCVCEEELCPMC